MTRPLQLLALFLVACEGPAKETCTSFAEMEITDPDGGAPVTESMDVPGYLRYVIDSFAEGTTRAGVCVDEVRLVAWPEDAESDELPGAFLGPRIELSYDERTFQYLDNTFRHELCHAFDYAEGWMSREEPALFGADAPEAFAEACAIGPRRTAIEASVEAACGVDLGVGVQAYVNEHVYDAVDFGDVPADGSATITLDRARVLGLEEDAETWRWRAVAGGGDVYVVEWTTDSNDEVAPQIHVVDPTTGEETARWEVPGLTNNVSVFPSVDGPPLLIEQQGEGRFWRFDAAGTLTEGLIPDLYYAAGGAVVGDEVWIFGAMFYGVNIISVVRVDLDSSAVTTFPLPDLEGPGGGSWMGWSPTATADGRLEGGAWFGDDDTLGWVTYDPATDVWTSTALPAWFGHVIALEDGRFLARWEDALREYGGAGSGLAVVDADGAAWQLADDPCDADAVGENATLLNVDGVPYLWEFPHGWETADGREGHALTRVTVE